MIVVLAEVFWQTRYPKFAIVDGVSPNIKIATALLGVVTSTLTPTPIVINFYYYCHYYYYYDYDLYYYSYYYLNSSYYDDDYYSYHHHDDQ
jgi:hypothetical protein